MTRIKPQIEKTDTSLTMKRTYRATPARLFQAWTDPEQLNRWFHPDPRMHSVCEVDLRVGGRYRIEMHSDKGAYTVGGAYKEIIPDRKLSFTWRWLAAEDPDEMLVTVTFTPLNDAETELILIHQRLPTPEERDSHETGWIGTLEQLAAIL